MAYLEDALMAEFLKKGAVLFGITVALAGGGQSPVGAQSQASSWASSEAINETSTVINDAWAAPWGVFGYPLAGPIEYYDDFDPYYYDGFNSEAYLNNRDYDNGAFASRSAHRSRSFARQMPRSYRSISRKAAPAKPQTLYNQQGRPVGTVQ